MHNENKYEETLEDTKMAESLRMRGGSGRARTQWRKAH